jgi:hypothetical protein
MKPNQDEVLHELWIVTELVTENVIVHESETTVATGAQTLHAEVRVGRVFETDVIEAAPGPDRIEPAHGLAETSVLLEAAPVPSMITMSEADLEDANAVVLDPGWPIGVREAGPEPEQTGEIEAEKGEIAHARGCALIDGIEPALALDVTEVVPEMSDSVELITMIPEREIGKGIDLETVRETRDLPRDDEAERGLAMIVIKRSHARKNAIKLLRRNAKRKKRSHLTDEALLDQEPPPLPRDPVLARLRMTLKSGSRKRSRSGKRRPRHI